MSTAKAQRPRAMKPINVDIVRHVHQYGPCGLIELYDLFGGGCKVSADKNALESFRARLNHLTYSQHLLATGAHAARRWRAPLQDALPTPSPAAPAVTTRAEPWVGPVVPPAQQDLMHGPLYVPERGPALRAGSQDFMRCASRGDRC